MTPAGRSTQAVPSPPHQLCILINKKSASPAAEGIGGDGDGDDDSGGGGGGGGLDYGASEKGKDEKDGSEDKGAVEYAKAVGGTFAEECLFRLFSLLPCFEEEPSTSYLLSDLPYYYKHVSFEYVRTK